MTTWQLFQQEWSSLQDFWVQAPLSVVVLVVMTGVITFSITKWRYSGQVDSLREQVKASEQRERTVKEQVESQRRVSQVEQREVYLEMRESVIDESIEKEMKRRVDSMRQSILPLLGVEMPGEILNSETLQRLHALNLDELTKQVKQAILQAKKSEDMKRISEDLVYEGNRAGVDLAVKHFETIFLPEQVDELDFSTIDNTKLPILGKLAFLQLFDLEELRREMMQVSLELVDQDKVSQLIQQALESHFDIQGFATELKKIADLYDKGLLSEGEAQVLFSQSPRKYFNEDAREPIASAIDLDRIGEEFTLILGQQMTETAEKLDTLLPGSSLLDVKQRR